ncbi:TMEM175 family protein [Salinirubellus salinus]|uniref:TMEM175 family protein n=1 Tax=Salinirubellus salinus TaxID=1364945 RepID=A0A9E7R3K9_9EURY|nr:TMEM175 family protein [Salinirubellus salinus]UWM54025.1 TMEM175 family protein [Salinirubellus salinus]
MALPFRRESSETDRMLALSDGVIAIAITLLVLEITVPEIPAGSPLSVLPDLVFAQWHEFFGFVLSFLVIGSYWVNHRRIFIHIERHDAGIVWLNLLFLLMVAFIPFASSVFATYPDQFGIMFLSGTLTLTGLTLALLWSYASRRELLEEGLGSRAVEIQAARFLASPFVFVLSILVTAFDPGLGILTWLLLIPINGVLQSRLAENLEESDGESEVEATR